MTVALEHHDRVVSLDLARRIVQTNLDVAVAQIERLAEETEGGERAFWRDTKVLVSEVSRRVRNGATS